MTPADPRHGSVAGARAHYRDGGKPCSACALVYRRRSKQYRMYEQKTSAIGTQRRIHALQAIGHSRKRIAAELGYTGTGSLTYVMHADTVLIVTAERIRDLYDRWSMVVPDVPGADRARAWAKRGGYAPPLAWDDSDIDDPRAQPSVTAPATAVVDDVVVDRLLAGVTLPSTRPEREEAMRLWLARGGSERSLCLMHGWKDGRYSPQRGAA